MERAEQAGTALRVYGRCPEYSECFPYDMFDFGRSIPNGQQLSRFGPDGLDMTCREHRIRDLYIVGMPGRMAIAYHSRSDVNAGLWSGGTCLRRWTG